MPPIRVKICGVTTPADAEMVSRLGADAVGLNLYPRSPRYLPRDRFLAILQALPPFVEPVALFVSEPETTEENRVALGHLLGTGIRTLQLHGDLHFPHIWIGPLVRAFPVKDAADLRAIDDYLAPGYTPTGQRLGAVLVDAHVPGLHGGTGQTAPWHLLADYRPAVPLILAGGLTPENVAEAVRTVRPYAVDVASGVESRPGVKDAEKVRRFIDAARSA